MDLETIKAKRSSVLRGLEALERDDDSNINYSPPGRP
jgi:hypothetical protein